MEAFQFKQFTINQNKTAMKVGTDGVLLGAWVRLNTEINSILDIGTGTGLIALQLAQRSNLETIDALEIEPQAFEQTVENFEASNWGDRLYCYHTSLQEFTKEIDESYDLIVSNPPYYQDNHQIENEERAIARHNTSLTYHELISCTAKLLSKNGECAFIIPFEDEVSFLDLALKHYLFPLRITRVKGNEATSIKRSLLQFSFTKTQPEIDELVIEISRHQYTEAYKNLVKDFYLKM